MKSSQSQCVVVQYPQNWLLAIGSLLFCVAFPLDGAFSRERQLAPDDTQVSGAAPVDAAPFDATSESDAPQLFPASTRPVRPIDEEDQLTDGGSSELPLQDNRVGESEGLSYPAIHHAWARYPVGSWREMEITTETFDEEGNLYGKSVTTQVEVLKAVGEDSYQIDVQATVDISGKQINGDWNTRSLRLITDRPGHILRSQEFEEETLQIDNRQITCQVLEVTTSEDARNRTERIYYSPKHYPHILRREVLDSTSESDGDAVRDCTSVKTLAVPYYVGNRIVECSATHTTRRQEKGTSVSMRFVTQEIPGGEVASWSSDFNAAGQRIRWSVARLVDHGLAETDPSESRQTTRFGRRRGERAE